MSFASISDYPDSAPDCPHCNTPVDAATRITMLESEVITLKNQVAEAVLKLDQTEIELSRLRTLPPPTSPSLPTPVSLPSPTCLSYLLGAVSSAASSPTTSATTPPMSSTSDILTQLSRERAGRKEAEAKLTQVTNEIDDLTASLFENANELVANERRVRHKLEERVIELETRERQRLDRLGVLERAVGRIHRVKDMLSIGMGLGFGPSVNAIPPPNADAKSVATKKVEPGKNLAD